MDYPKFIISNQKEKSISIQRVKAYPFFQGRECLREPEETWHRDQDTAGQCCSVLKTNSTVVEASWRL